MNETKLIDDDKTHNILIVDDDHEELKALFSTIQQAEQLKSELSSAKDSKGALYLLEKRNFDLILTDYKMPDMDGVELLKLVKEKYPKILRMLITGYPDIELTKKAVNNAAVHHFIEKPWDNDELVAVIHGALKRKDEKESNGSNEVDNVKEGLKLVNVAHQELLHSTAKSKYKQMVMFEFVSQTEFNKFFFKIKQIKNVSIDDIHIFENKYIIKLNVYRKAYEKIK